MTFSLVAHDESTGAFGMVVCSSSPAVASRCTHLRAGVGGVSSQNVTNPALGELTLDALATGVDAQTALTTALSNEQFPDYRQVLVVDPQGATAVHSGGNALGIFTSAQVPHAVAAGNMLRDKAVIDALITGYRRSEESTFEARLLAGLDAAIEAGGEAGPVHSAGLAVVEDVSWPVTDLRVDFSDDPIADLHALWSVWAPQKNDYRVRGVDPTSAPSYGVPGDE